MSVTVYVNAGREWERALLSECQNRMNRKAVAGGVIGALKVRSMHHSIVIVQFPTQAVAGYTTLCNSMKTMNFNTNLYRKSNALLLLEHALNTSFVCIKWKMCCNKPRWLVLECAVALRPTSHLLYSALSLLALPTTLFHILTLWYPGKHFDVGLYYQQNVLRRFTQPEWLLSTMHTFSGCSRYLSCSKIQYYAAGWS